MSLDIANITFDCHDAKALGNSGRPCWRGDGFGFSQHWGASVVWRQLW